MGSSAAGSSAAHDATQGAGSEARHQGLQLRKVRVQRVRHLPHQCARALQLCRHRPQAQRSSRLRPAYTVLIHFSSEPNIAWLPQHRNLTHADQQDLGELQNPFAVVH